jgi:hypothetical protein
MATAQMARDAREALVNRHCSGDRRPVSKLLVQREAQGYIHGRSRHVNSAPDQFTLTHSATTDFIWIKVVFLYHVSEQSFFKNNFVPFIRFDL